MNNFENCGYYVDEECTICGMGTDGEDTFCKYCKDNPNCYYKQLLKFKIENEWLKALCDTYRTCYQAKHGDIKGLLFKYKQTLKEIKKIAKLVEGTYEALDPQALQEIRQIISEVENGRRNNIINI